MQIFVRKESSISLILVQYFFLNKYSIETKLEIRLHNSPPLSPTGGGWVMGGNFDLPSSSNISKTLRVYGVFTSTF